MSSGTELWRSEYRSGRKKLDLEERREIWKIEERDLEEIREIFHSYMLTIGFLGLQRMKLVNNDVWIHEREERSEIEKRGLKERREIWHRDLEKRRESWKSENRSGREIGKRDLEDRSGR